MTLLEWLEQNPSSQLVGECFAVRDDLMDAARKMATKISRKPPEALRMTKRLLKESEFQRLDTALEMAAGMQALAQATKDHQEAANAFVEKRRPEFKGE